jgi:SOS-response transcriptional repressor LexA
VGFFQAVKSRLVKFETKTGKIDEDLDSAIKQIVSKAVVSDRVVDIFAAAGIKKPDISILSDEFLAEVKDMPHKNLAFELLKKLLNDEISLRLKKNLIQGRSFRELLEKALRRYQNNAIVAARIFDELIELAKEMREASKRGEELNLNEEEVAFYDTLEVNDSAVKVLGDETLRMIARELVQGIRNNLSIDWAIKETVQAKMRVMVKKILRKHGYPPDKEKKATETVLQQAVLLCKDWTQPDVLHDMGQAVEKSDLYFSDIIPDERIDDDAKFETALPVYSLEAVATAFGKEAQVDRLGWVKVNPSKKLSKDMFVAKVTGKSMEPAIPDGSYCIFRFEKGGSRNGLTVLVESRRVSDPETMQSFTIKRYKSEKEYSPDGTWRHKKITLSPLNRQFKDIIIENVSPDDFRVVAEFVEVIDGKR